MLTINIENLEKLKLQVFLSLSTVYSKCGHEYEKTLKGKNQLKY